MPKATQPASGRARIGPIVVGLQTLCIALAAQQQC